MLLKTQTGILSYDGAQECVNHALCSASSINNLIGIYRTIITAMVCKQLLAIATQDTRLTVFAHIHSHMHSCTHIHTYMYMHKWLTHTCTLKCTLRAHAHTYTQKHTPTHMYTSTHMYMYKVCTHLSELILLSILRCPKEDVKLNTDIQQLPGQS